MKRNLHRATGLTTDRAAARLPFKVVTPEGRLLAGCGSEAAAQRVAAVINTGRAQPVRVVRGQR